MVQGVSERASELENICVFVYGCSCWPISISVHMNYRNFVCVVVTLLFVHFHVSFSHPSQFQSHPSFNELNQANKAHFCDFFRRERAVFVVLLCTLLICLLLHAINIELYLSTTFYRPDIGFRWTHRICNVLGDKCMASQYIYTYKTFFTGFHSKFSLQ